MEWLLKSANCEPSLNQSRLPPSWMRCSPPSSTTPSKQNCELTSEPVSWMMSMMNIQQATRQYETWLAGHVRVVKSDLGTKHELMAQDAFLFLRGTFYRWMQLFPALCPKLAGAPTVLAVGDLHVENYGTWRDAEGRLVWGINDFDEAFQLPYTIDLVRLATSARLAIDGAHLKVAHKEACASILSGYTDALRAGG